ncbi:MAG: 30S ribosome-binding factor RbfA [Oscillospiraceae bacterium]
MDGYKLNRINNDVMRELTDVLRSVKDPRVTGMLTIVKVNVTNDLSFCDVYVSSIDGIEHAKEAVKGLKSASGFIRTELSHRLKIRKTPQLRFIADDSIEISSDIIKMLKDLN